MLGPPHFLDADHLLQFLSPCCSVAELLATLRLCYDSLLSTGDVHVANAHLLDVLRQVGPHAIKARRLGSELGMCC